MNGDDIFEKRLKEVPHRPIPAQWRRDILRASRAAAPARNSPLSAWAARIAAANSVVSRMLWPHPKAWIGLTAVWLLILVLTLAEREPEQAQFVRAVAPPSPQMLEMLREQEQLLAELVGSTERAEPHPPVLPQPRSQRHEEFLNT